MESGCKTIVRESGVSRVQELLTDFGSRAGGNMPRMHIILFLFGILVLLHLAVT